MLAADSNAGNQRGAWQLILAASDTRQQEQVSPAISFQLPDLLFLQVSRLVQY